MAKSKIGKKDIDTAFPESAAQPLFVKSKKILKKEEAEALRSKIWVLEQAQKRGVTLDKAETARQLKARIDQEDKIADHRASVLKSRGDALINNFKAMGAGVEKYFDVYAEHFSKINTQMLGTGKDFNSLLGNIKKGLNNTTNTSNEKVLNNVAKLLDKGITYNVEQRAFLETISEKIATTFDAANGTLTRLIRLSGRDLTQAYLGMESVLTEFLNKSFSDSSYLTSGLSKTVSESLIEATASMGYEKGTNLEYVVQKWLGSFTSVGMSQDFVQKLATGLGQLGSGDITGLTSNTQLNALLATSANNAGLSYGSLMNGGLDATTADQLFKGLYKQLYSMAESQDRVTQSQYAQVFGLSLSDLVGVVQLSEDTIKTISSSIYNYDQMQTRTLNEIIQAGNRTSFKEKIDNAFSNLFSNMGESIVNTAGGAGYITYMIADMLDNADLGKILLPTGWMAGLAVGANFNEVNIAGMVKTGIMGMSALGQIGNIMAILTGNNSVDISGFGGSATTQRGTGLTLDSMFKSGMSTSQSSATYIGTSDGDTITKGSVMDMQSTTGITGTGTPDKAPDSSEHLETVASMTTTTVTILGQIKDMVNDIRTIQQTLDSRIFPTGGSL